VLVSAARAQSRKNFAPLFSKSGCFPIDREANASPADGWLMGSLPHGRDGGAGREQKASFCEQKETKNPVNYSRAGDNSTGRVSKSFCAAFFKKRPLSLSKPNAAAAGWTGRRGG
jgi:hypothetical protein